MDASPDVEKVHLGNVLKNHTLKSSNSDDVKLDQGAITYCWNEISKCRYVCEIIFQRMKFSVK